MIDDWMPLDRDFFDRPVLEVAPGLLGTVLVHDAGPDGLVAVRLTEVEAYQGTEDPASHAYRGHTARNAVMFGPAGRLYVYRSHGLHWCANIVTGEEGMASAVLLRAGRVTEGHELARHRRGMRVEDPNLARGPGNLCQALGITAQHNGTVLTRGASLSLLPGEPVAPELVRSGPRVGVTQAHDVPWRYWLADERSVSAYRVSPRAPK